MLSLNACGYSASKTVLWGEGQMMRPGEVRPPMARAARQPKHSDIISGTGRWYITTFRLRAWARFFHDVTAVMRTRGVRLEAPKMDS